MDLAHQGELSDYSSQEPTKEYPEVVSPVSTSVGKKSAFSELGFAFMVGITSALASVMFFTDLNLF